MTALRHLHFTQSLEPLYGGGLGSSTLALHRQMLAMGIESTLCTTHGATPQTSPEHTYEFKRIKPDFLYFAPKLKFCGKAFVSSADVIHGHGLYVGTNYVFGLEARRQKKPITYHVQGMFEPYILARSQWKKRLVHWLFEDANFQKVRLWRALTSKEADQIRSCGISAPIVIAPNGLNPNEYERPASAAWIKTPFLPELRKTAPRALFLSRIHPKKGLDLLMPAWAQLGEASQDWELVVAGPDERGYMAEVQTLAEKLGISQRVIFTGPVTGRAKLELFYSADLFVLPSYSEGFPMSLLEAIACELPVVATRECNFPELFEAGGGWQCGAECNSVGAALRAALDASEVERRQRGAAGRRLLEQHYTWENICRRLLEACETFCR